MPGRSRDHDEDGEDEDGDEDEDEDGGGGGRGGRGGGAGHFTALFAPFFARYSRRWARLVSQSQGLVHWRPLCALEASFVFGEFSFY